MFGQSTIDIPEKRRVEIALVRLIDVLANKGVIDNRDLGLIFADKLDSRLLKSYTWLNSTDENRE